MLQPLWEPSEQRIKDSNMYRFMQHVNSTYGMHFTDYNALYLWSVENIGDFGAELWKFAGIRATKGYDQVIDDPAKMLSAEPLATASFLRQRPNLPNRCARPES